MRVPEANAPETQPEIDLIHHQMNQPQSFGDFGHGCFSRPYTKLTCPPPPTGVRGPRFHTNRRRGVIRHARDPPRSLANRKSTSCAFPYPTTTTGARGPRFHTTGDEVSYARDLVARKLEEEAQVVPFAFHAIYNYIVATGRTDDKPTVYCRRQWNPCHMDFDLVPASH